MPTNRKSGNRERKRDLWSRRIEAWRQSGQTQAEFSRRRGWSLAAFGWWKRRLARPAPVVGAQHPEEGGSFLPVQVVRSPGAEVQSWACELAYADGNCLRLRSVPAPEFLLALLDQRAVR